MQTTSSCSAARSAIASGCCSRGCASSGSRGDTVLTGAVLDQAHLHGLIERIQELGIELVSVNPLPRKGPDDQRSRTPDTIVLIHGFWVTPRSWEHWIAHYEAQGLQRPRARLPRLRGRGRGAQRRPHADRGGHRAGRSSSTSRRVVGALDYAADPHRPLGRRRVHADPARPRLRRRRRGDQLGARPRASSGCRCRRSRRRSRCSRTPPTATAPSASRTSSGTTRSRTRSARRSRARCTSATTSPRPARSSGAARWRTSTPARTTATSTTRTTTARRCCSSPAARTT